ncbi:alpha-protein kinase vwkA [Biomphalaria glabrata]|nr:alpha-protein kinase vwkA [Biomphalaria glabrata]
MSLRLLHLQNETNASCPDLKGQNYRASFNTHAASKGQRKKIYHGHLDGKGPRKGEHAVVKVFRDAPGTEAMCDTEIEKHKLARRLARKFNKLVPDDHYKIDFTLPLKSTVERLGVGCYLSRHKSRQMDKKEWVLIEENLLKKGDYVSFIRKTGLRNQKDPTTLDAFLHFTYHESDGKYVFCGFQGVLTDEGYLLTTPCIHSTDVSFGVSTDKGPKYIRKVFKQHKCNNLCYSFKLPEPCSDEEDSSDTGEESDIKSVDSSSTDGKKYEQDLVGNMENMVLENGDFLTKVGIEKIEETPEEREKTPVRRESVKRKESIKQRDHRSNVVALGSLKKQPSF